MARSSTILNLARLERKLRRMPAAAKAKIRQKMAEAADEIVATMKNLAPVLQGQDKRRTPGALRDSIGWTWGAPPRGSLVISTLRGAGFGGDLTITIYAGGSDVFWARWLEHGTAKMPAQPYFFVAWRAKKKVARRKINQGIREAARHVASGG